jgi:hypothetical protein
VLESFGHFAHSSCDELLSEEDTEEEENGCTGFS